MSFEYSGWRFLTFLFGRNIRSRRFVSNGLSGSRRPTFRPRLETLEERLTPSGGMEPTGSAAPQVPTAQAMAAYPNQAGALWEAVHLTQGALQAPQGLVPEFGQGNDALALQWQGSATGLQAQDWSDVTSARADLKQATLLYNEARTATGGQQTTLVKEANQLLSDAVPLVNAGLQLWGEVDSERFAPVLIANSATNQPAPLPTQPANQPNLTLHGGVAVTDVPATSPAPALQGAAQNNAPPATLLLKTGISASAPPPPAAPVPAYQSQYLTGTAVNNPSQKAWTLSNAVQLRMNVNSPGYTLDNLANKLHSIDPSVNWQQWINSQFGPEVNQAINQAAGSMPKGTGTLIAYGTITAWSNGKVTVTVNVNSASGPTTKLATQWANQLNAKLKALGLQ